MLGRGLRIGLGLGIVWLAIGAISWATLGQPHVLMFWAIVVYCLFSAWRDSTLRSSAQP